jgi:hypothetical protein
MFGISSLGTIGLSLSLRSITSAINDLDVSAANSLSNVFNSLTRIIELKSELSSLSAEFGHMAASINSVETPKAVAFSGAVGAGAGANNNQTAANSEPVQIVLKLNEHVLGTVIAQLNTRYAGTVNNSYYPNQVIGPTPTKVRTA